MSFHNDLNGLEERSSRCRNRRQLLSMVDADVILQHYSSIPVYMVGNKRKHNIRDGFGCKVGLWAANQPRCGKTPEAVVGKKYHMISDLVPVGALSHVIMTRNYLIVMTRE